MHIDEILQKLDELEAEYNLKHAAETHKDWRAYYGGFADGIRKARYALDPAVQYMGEKAMQ